MQTDRERMLNRIRQSLRASRAFLEAEAARAPHAPPSFVHPRQDDPVAQFAAELVRLEGHVYCCTGDEAAIETIRGILVQQQATALLAWDLEQIGLVGLDALLAECGIVLLTPAAPHAARHRDIQALEPAGVCLSGADAGIAESGTLVLRSGQGRGRMASLLAPVHIAVLRTDQIVRGLGEALGRFQTDYGPDPLAGASSLVLISGPSRTGDIELTLTLGVHGPRELHVILVENGSNGKRPG
jgi:L-lactate dehydrogenase complex protein LldG